MNERMHSQRQHEAPRPAGPATPSLALEQARDELAQLFAAADEIIDGIRQQDNQAFLTAARQSGGE